MRLSDAARSAHKSLATGVWAALLEPHVELVGHRELIELRRQSRAQLKLDDDGLSYPFMPLHKLPQDDGAACLDGSPPAFWFLEGAESTK